MLKQDLTVYDPYPEGIESTAIYANKVGQTYFEINNYLGNVNAVITDRKSANLTPSASNASTWEAVVMNTSDYYPFGMVMPGRVNSYGAGVAYRYAYNGMEKDDEVKGKGNSINYKWRGHDPRLARFFQQDPLASIFPHNSPYAFCENSPIGNIELEGLEKASLQEIQAARSYAKTALGNNPNGTSKQFLGLTRDQLLKQIDARLNALEKGLDVTDVKDGYWFCGPTAMIHVLLWFDPMSYVIAAIDLFENGSTLLDGKVIVYTPPVQNVSFNQGKFGREEAVDFILISSLRSSVNEVAPKEMDLDNNFHVGTLPWELDNMARHMEIPTYQRNRFYVTNLRAIEKSVKKGRLVVLLDDGDVYSGQKQDRKGIHYITVHDITVDRGNKTVTLDYWQHGAIDSKTMSIGDFKKAIKGQYTFGNSGKSERDKSDGDLWDHRDGSSGPTLPDGVS